MGDGSGGRFYDTPDAGDNGRMNKPLPGGLKSLQAGARSITPASAGEIYDLPRSCAVSDKPYLARYARGDGGLFSLAGMVKLERTAGAGKASAAPKVALALSQISRDSPVERCPWCGVESYLVYCPACDTYVCAGRVSKRREGSYFRCRSSCGREDFLSGSFDQFTGWKREAPPAGKASAALPEADKRLALPRADRPRLKS